MGLVVPDTAPPLFPQSPLAGIYLDEIAYDRVTMERARRQLGDGGPIDHHSDSGAFVTSPALGYMELYPWISRLWCKQRGKGGRRVWPRSCSQLTNCNLPPPPPPNPPTPPHPPTRRRGL